LIEIWANQLPPGRSARVRDIHPEPCVCERLTVIESSGVCVASAAASASPSRTQWLGQSTRLTATSECSSSNQHRGEQRPMDRLRGSCTAAAHIR
jgi:hypothetical protein